MPTSPFDYLPPPNQRHFRAAIRNNLQVAVRSLVKFSDSVRARKFPDWPPTDTYSSFTAQLHHFRSLSKRAPNAQPIQLIREIDHLWPRLRLVKALERSLEALGEYVGNSLLGPANTAGHFEHNTNPEKPLLLNLLTSTKRATAQDLDVMSPLLPQCFHILKERASTKQIRAASYASSAAVDNLHAAIARCAQSYLISERRAYLQRQGAARELRQFIWDLRHRPYRKKLFGFTDGQINEWDLVDRRGANRARQQRHRQKRRHSSLHSA